jgi:hypothetical protein
LYRSFATAAVEYELNVTAQATRRVHEDMMSLGVCCRAGGRIGEGITKEKKDYSAIPSFGD